MCDCVEKLNEKLKERNTKISVSLSWSAENGIGSLANPIIVTEKADNANRKKPVRLLASYCPFCGEKMEKPI